MAATIEAHGPMPGTRLARELRVRTADVFAELHANPRFVQAGRRRGSTFALAERRAFDADEAAACWDCDPKTAAEILFGAGGFLELGLVAQLNGNGRVFVTELGVERSRAFCGLGGAA
jgi:hypothetical protein